MAYNQPLNLALEQLYKPIREQGQKEIERQAELAKQQALEDFARRGLYQSGAVSKYISDKIDEQKARALSGLESDIAKQQAGYLANLYNLSLQQEFEKDMALMKRKWETDDFLRNTILNLAESVVNPFASALGTKVGYNLAPDVYNKILNSMAGQNYFAGRGGAPATSFSNRPGSLPGLG